MRPQEGQIIGGKYRLGRLIGDGGMGTVYEARHQVLGSPVALKFLHAELAKRSGLAKRFLQEAKVSASIQSPHVTRVSDVDTTPEGAPYIVMELLSGETLQQMLDRRHKLPSDQAIDFTLQMLAGLEAAHALGVVHRDLKPDNVYVTPSTGGPLVKLLDFGIAKLRETNEYQKGLTRPGAVMGTPEYMAPEQFYSADRVDHRADIYSLGAMLYEMLCGDRPADGDDAGQIIQKVTTGKVRPLSEREPSVPPGLAQVVHRAIDPTPENRFASATEMRLALAPFAGELSHAGRLAATPAPGGSIITGPPAAGDPGQPASKSSVAPTLPPEDEAPAAGAPARTEDLPPLGVGGATDSTADEAPLNPAAPAGGTQEAPAVVLQGVTGQMAATGTPMPGGPVPGSMVPGGAPPYSALPNVPQYTGPTNAPRRSNKLVGGLVALLLGMLAAGGVIALIATQGGDDDGDTPPLLTTAAPNTTIAPQGGDTTDPVPPPDPGAPPAPNPSPPVAGTTTRPPTNTRDAGAGKADAGTGGRRDGGLGFPPGVIPSGLPPFPSGIPTKLPPIPGLPPMYESPPANSGGN